MEEYDDPEGFKLFGILYRATHAEGNAVYLRLLDTAEWQQFEVIDNMLRFGHWPVADGGPSKSFMDLCERRAVLWSALAKKSSKMIEEVVG